MRGFIGTFKKKSGELRTMKFVKITDLPEEFLNEAIKGTGAKRSMPTGLELVWDVEKKSFRTFNWDASVGSITEVVLEESLLL